MQIVRRQPGVSGEIFYHLRNLFDNRALADVVRAEYLQPALVPASPWLDSTPPAKPNLSIGESRAGLRFEWATSGNEPAWLWVLQFRINGVWTTEILPANQTARTFSDSKPDLIAVSAVDRVGNEGAPAALQKTMPSPLHPEGKNSGLNWHRNSDR